MKYADRYVLGEGYAGIDNEIDSGMPTHVFLYSNNGETKELHFPNIFTAEGQSLKEIEPKYRLVLEKVK